MFAAGLKANRDQILTDLNRYKAQFAGLDPEKAKAALAAAAQLEEEKAKAAGNWEQLRTQLVEQHTKAADAITSQLTADRAFIREVLAEKEAQKEIVAAEGNPTFLLAHVLKHVDVRRDDATGKWTQVVTDAAGNARIAGTDGKPMTIAQLVAEFKANEQFAGAFKGSGASGSGAAGSSTPAGAAGTVRSRADLKSDRARSDYIGKHGYAAYTALPEK